MDSLYNHNGLVMWNERDINLRQMFEKHFTFQLRSALLETNPAWRFHQIESPVLTPRALVNDNYTNEDIWVQETLSVHESELVLRPETTPGSYAYAKQLLTNGEKPPFVVWQTGKSFRREQDQVTKNMRLKEFYQQEFQCFHTEDTLNDYQSAILEPVRKMIGEMVGLPSRIVDSDRLPSYSLKTLDVEVDNGDKWMELCSISLRTDFSPTFRYYKKDQLMEKKLRVLEVAIGLDRCVYNFNLKNVL